MKVRIRDASSIVLVDRRGPAPKILMGRRAAAHVFMPNVYVFPGGRVDYKDRFAPSASDYQSDTAELLMQKMAGRPSALRARMMGLAAIRETFEEVGLMIGASSEPPKRKTQENWSPFFEKGLLPDLSRLTYLARAITPPGQKRRFDTRFFICDVSDYLENQAPAESIELEDIQWVTPQEAGELKTHFITTRILLAAEEALASPNFGKKIDLVPFYRAKPGAKGKAKLLTHLKPGHEPEIVGEVKADI